MLTVNEAAKNKILDLMKSAVPDIYGIRITADAKSPFKPEYKIDFEKDEDGKENDTIIYFDDFNVYIEPGSHHFLEDATLDLVDNEWGGEFKIENPSIKPPDLTGSVPQRIQKIIDDQINPSVAAHGGVVTLIDVKESTAYIELGGGCKGCGMVDVTLKQGVEVLIKQNVPEITEILDVTDQASGTNPYFQPSAK